MLLMIFRPVIISANHWQPLKRSHLFRAAARSSQGSVLFVLGLAAICSVKCDNQFFQKILEFSEELGFDYCAYGMRIPLPLSYPKTFLFNNYPKEWQMQYQRKNYLAIDPSVRVATRSLLPVIWTDDLFNSTPELWEEARSFGLRFGVAQSIRDFNGSISMLTLARSEEPITAPELNAKRFKIAWLTPNSAYRHVKIPAAGNHARSQRKTVNARKRSPSVDSGWQNFQRNFAHPQYCGAHCQLSYQQCHDKAECAQ